MNQAPANHRAPDKTTSRPGPARWCLFLDVDGTLLDIAPTPDQVRVSDPVRTALAAVHAALDGAVALISGRSLATLDALFAPQRLPAAGLHGLERRDARGRTHRHELDRRPLAAARQALAAAAAAHDGVLLEDKGDTLALHYRNAPRLAPALQRLAGRVAASLGPDYQLLEGQQVLEIKPALATKADAVVAFLGEAPFAGRRPLYVGDDITDLDGFAAVEAAGGLSVGVGARVRGQLQLAAPADVLRLLGDLARGEAPAA